MPQKVTVFVIVLVLVLGLAAAPLAAQEDEELTEVSVVLQWVTQAQFAGYYAADALGYYEERGLDVTIIPGGPDTFADDFVASGDAEFGVRPFLTTLAARENGADFVSIARINQVPPTLMVSFVEAGITNPDEMRNRVIGSWLGGNEPELFALLRQFGIEPFQDVTIVQQGFDMSQLLDGEIEAAQATIYNEYAQVLETINPDTGELYQPEDFNVISVRDYGIFTLQDNIFASEAWLEDSDNEETALAFLEATVEGWIYCRDNPNDCVDIVLDAGTALGRSHQEWMMNEFNDLLWPAPNGLGMLNRGDELEQSVDIGLTYELITRVPDPEVFRVDLIEQALANLEEGGLDIYGEDFEKQAVTLNEGGE